MWATCLPSVSTLIFSQRCQRIWLRICIKESLFVSICVFLRLFLFARLLEHTCVVTARPPQVIMHLLRKCCQNMLTPQSRGLWTARGDEWVGKECVCTLCIWATSPFSSNCTRQELKLGGCRRCLHEWVNLYHVCHRKIKALVYSGARLSAPISISKLRGALSPGKTGPGV